MGYRGRLIWKFTAELQSLDTAATKANGSPLASGYDRDFREPVKKKDGTTSRVYGAPFRLECQVETEVDPFEALAMLNTGDDNTTEVKLVFHFRELEDRGLVDDRGQAKIKKGDRLRRIFDKDFNEVDHYDRFELVVTQAQPRSYGLSGGRRNLLLVTFRKRDKSTAEV